MNVMVYNKYKDLLISLNLDVMKSIEGVFNVDEIIDTFSNFYYDKMILDITAIRDYKNTDNLQKLAMNLNMENVILLLDDSPESDSKAYLSKLISLGIYNFTRNSEGINYLLVHPHTYRDVANLHDVSEMDMKLAESSMKKDAPKVSTTKVEFVEMKDEDPTINNVTNAKLKIVGFKNVTMHAGATSLIYMLKKTLGLHKKVAAIEVNKVDFLYFNDPELISTTTTDLAKELMKKTDYDYIFVDLNDYDDTSICTEVYYLLEPSTIMLNRAIRRNRNVFENLKKEKVVLNKCVLSKSDIATFEYETKLKVLHAIPPCDDRGENIEAIRVFVNKVNL